jgi:hypothetical protein
MRPRYQRRTDRRPPNPPRPRARIRRSCCSTTGSISYVNFYVIACGDVDPEKQLARAYFEQTRRCVELKHTQHMGVLHGTRIVEPAEDLAQVSAALNAVDVDSATSFSPQRAVGPFC